MRESDQTLIISKRVANDEKNGTVPEFCRRLLILS
jgi:hypothetical protein